MKQDKILFFDIETSHCIAAVYGTGQQYVSDEQILKDRKVLTISYCWYGDKKVKHLILDLSKHNLMKFDDEADKKMILDFTKIYNQAICVIAHNGKKFDIQRLNARLFRYKLPPLRPVLVDDTYTMVKGIGLTSRKLRFINRVLGTPDKIHTELKMWLDIVWRHDKSQLKKMAIYCDRDVECLINNYPMIRLHGGSQLNKSLLRGSLCCIDCGSNHLISIGYRYTKTQRYRRYQCMECQSCRTSDRHASENSIVK